MKKPKKPAKTYLFNPDWVVHPSSMLREHLLGHGVAHLVQNSSLGEAEVHALLDRCGVITPAIAAQLERGLGRPANYWLSLQRYFDEGVKAGKTVEL